MTAEERTQFERQIQIAEILENKQGLTQDQIKAELQATTALFEQQDATKQLLETNKELTAEQQKQIQFAEQLAQTIEQGIKGAIMGAIDGTKSLSESLSGILRQLGGMFLNKGIGSFKKADGTGGSGLLGLLPGFANGGRPPVGRASIVGERGPELFVPDRAGTIVPNGAMGSTSVVVNVDATAPRFKATKATLDQLGRLIGQAVQAELIKQKRPGGLQHPLMATFPSINPTYGATKRNQPSVRNVQFGDGYSSRIRFGLNTDLKTWSLKFEVSETDADTIETFLEARGGAEHFDWSPPDETETYKWICQDWSKSIPYLNRATITATFQQVIEP